MNFWVKITTGSHLHHLNGPYSDLDQKIVGIPSKEDCFLNKIPKIKSKISNKEDIEIIPIQEFIKQGVAGQTNVLDMVHADDDMIVYYNESEKLKNLWKEIRENRCKFYTKNMKGLLGYCVSQSQKYAYKIEKYNEICDFIKFISDKIKNCKNGDKLKLFDIYDDIKETNYIKKTIEKGSKNNDNRCILFDKRVIQIYTPLYKTLEILNSVKNSFGSRVKDSKTKKDNKSICHAFRIGYQLKHIYQNGDYFFPLPETEYLKKIKEGEYDFEKDGISEKLSNLIENCISLSQKSEFPEKVDIDFWNNIILKAYGY